MNAKNPLRYSTVASAAVELNVLLNMSFVNTLPLIDEFGYYPHQFLNLLSEGNSNRNLDLLVVTKTVGDALKECPVHGFDPDNGSLWAVSDNGDYFFEMNDGRIAIVDGRAGIVEYHNLEKREVVERLPLLMSEVFR